MANKDHSLDDGIIQAAYAEFLAYGFQKASLHKIAEKAGVTTGAIYTRYKNPSPFPALKSVKGRKRLWDSCCTITIISG